MAEQYNPQHAKEVGDYRIRKLRQYIADVLLSVERGASTEVVTRNLSQALTHDDSIAAQNAEAIELNEWSNNWGDDFRDYLEGKPIHSGAALQLLQGDSWVDVRYELADHRTRQVELHGRDEVLILDRETMRFRWPIKKD